MALNRINATTQLLNVMAASISGTAFNYIFAIVPTNFIPTLAQTPYLTVHYDMPRTLQAFPFQLPEFPVTSEQTLPVFGAPLTLDDPLLGTITVPTMTIPGFKPPAAPGLPVGLLALGSSKAQTVAPQVEMSGYTFIPTTKTKAIIVDVPTTLTGKGILAGISDTGLSPWHPQFVGRNVSVMSEVAEVPYDLMGHGSWCASALGGSPWSARLGNVEGIAPGVDMVSAKSLTVLGFGTTSSILSALQALANAGAKVVSLSLGGALQGTVNDDPDIKVVEMLSAQGMLFVIAAGNAGPNEWTIGSPGAAPSALTVASMSITDQPQVAYWSSRGPQGSYYQTNPGSYQTDLSTYGDNLLKPDVMAPGGGRAANGATPDEIIYSGLTGWFDGYYSLLPSLAEGMHGTSQATPQVAGLVAMLLEGGLITSTQDIKNIMSNQGAKAVDSGYGLIKLSHFLAT